MRALEQLAEGRVEEQVPDAEADRAQGVSDRLPHPFLALVISAEIVGLNVFGRAFAMFEKLKLCARAPTPMPTRAMTAPATAKRPEVQRG